MKRIGLVAVGCLLCVFLLGAGRLQILPRERMIDGQESGSGDEVTCSTVYYHTCSSASCVSSTAAGSCCGDCRHPDGTHSPCQACKAN